MENLLHYAADPPLDPANLPQIASLYSQLAGVLAGFAFAALTALAIAQITSGTSTSRSLESFIPLLGGFIGLVTSSLNYAIVAGEVAGTARVAELQTIAGFGFSVAGLMLFYSMVVLLRGLEKDSPNTASAGVSESAAKLTRGIIGGLVPLLIGLLYGGLRDHLDIVYGRIETGIEWPDIGSWSVAVLTAAGSILIAVRMYRTTDTSADPVRRLTMVSVVLSLASLVGTNVLITSSDRNSSLPDFVSFSVLVAFSVFGTLVHYSAAKYRAA